MSLAGDAKAEAIRHPQSASWGGRPRISGQVSVEPDPDPVDGSN
jgi:hypothetical protein